MAKKKNQLPVVLKAKEIKPSKTNEIKVSGGKTKVKKEAPKYVDAEIVERKPPSSTVKTKSFNLNILTSALTLIFTLVSAMVIILWIWFFCFNARPTTTFNAQISTIGSTSEKLAMEFNQLRGKVGTGQELNELKITSYTDERLTTIFSSGIQTLGTPNFHNINHEPDLFTTKLIYHREFDKTNYFYYNEDANNHSYIASDSLSNDDFFIIEIKNKKYKLDFSNKEIKFGRFLWAEQFYKVTPVSLFECMYNTVNSLAVGDYVVNMPLTEYFHISEYSEEDKRFNLLDVQSQNKIKFEVKVHIEDKGVVNHVQSIFNNVSGNPNFNLDGIEEKEYWKVSSVLTLDINDFSNSNGYLSLNKDLINYVNVYSNMEVYIDLKINSKIKGFNYYALYGIPVKEIKITSDISQQFEIKNLALKNTGININDIVTTNVQLVEVLNG